MSDFITQRMAGVHIEAMLRVEQSSRENFWNKEVFLKHLRIARHGGHVAFCRKTLVGFVAFEHFEKHIQIWNLVVARRFRNHGVARLLIDKIQSDVLRFNVREANLPAQMLLKKTGFLCDSIARNYFIDHIHEGVSQEDAYCFGRGQKEKFRITDRVGAAFVEPRTAPKNALFGVPDFQHKA
jgi:ribosomal protein S18 acetylase RimI-like enzyme